LRNEICKIRPLASPRHFAKVGSAGPDAILVDPILDYGNWHGDYPPLVP
jgi:hypothetical protein